MADWGPRIIDLMDRLGVPFNRTPEGFRDQRRFGGHTRDHGKAPVRRSCYAADRTGHMILQTLFQNCVKEGVEFYDKGQYESARLAFIQAYALKKHPAAFPEVLATSSRSGEGIESREHEDAAARLDEWLSRLEAPTKLVLRGNHDPPVAAFPLSGATYVTSVSQFEAAGLSFTLVPYCKGPLRGKLPPSDVLVSHVPPKRVLDRATGGEEAGDDSLRTAVRRATRKPRLWLFGHIHEGAGAARVRFGTRADPATVLVNAANANPGIARRLIQGPVMIEVEMP
jgi:hypothetical protein